MYYIENIPIDVESIVNAYNRYYYDQFQRTAKYNFVNLFGIRVSANDTSIPDDFLGAIRYTSNKISTLDGYEILVSKASLDPAPTWLSKPFDAEAKRKGGSAFLREGQHIYTYYATPNKPSWRDGGKTCSFCPTKPVPVYRWRANQTEINNWRQRKTPLSSTFDRDLESAKRSNFKNTRIFLSDSTDTCIHKAWSNTLTIDSAGCQVIPPSDIQTFRNICSWASQHVKKGYGNSFTYTLFTKDQFVSANQTQGIFNIFRNIF